MQRKKITQKKHTENPKRNFENQRVRKGHKSNKLKTFSNFVFKLFFKNSLNTKKDNKINLFQRR